ncbi:MAG: integrase family protein [Mucilaginibacter sp.]|nr:integrase family protein [Mucilaginibacter sp.]
MKTNFSLLFYLKKQKVYASGPMPVYMRITVNGKRAEVSAGRDCEPSGWNSHAGRGIGTKSETRALNSYLDTLQTKVMNAHQQLIGAGKEITAEKLRDQFIGRVERAYYVVALFNEHNDQVKALIGNGFEANTLKSYRSSFKHLSAFVQHHYGIVDMDVKNLNHAFIVNYEFYLKTVCKCSGVSAAKYIKHLKKIVNNCLANKWLSDNPFINYRSKAKAKEKEFLMPQELEAIAIKSVTIDRLAQVRDIFIFCCYTGLCYADVQKLQRHQIATGIDGEQWIFTTRQKTDTSSRIPLLPVAADIVNKYADHPQCSNKNLVLPVLSNQRMNSYLKEIADICGVTKILTFHMARHTFATTVTLSNGVPLETVSKMLGHNSIKTTQHYAKILDLKVSQDMAALKQKYAGI